MITREKYNELLKLVKRVFYYNRFIFDMRKYNPRDVLHDVILMALNNGDMKILEEPKLFSSVVLRRLYSISRKKEHTTQVDNIENLAHEWPDFLYEKLDEGIDMFYRFY